jgi:hypothetical protein
VRAKQHAEPSVVRTPILVVGLVVVVIVVERRAAEAAE